MVDGVEPTGEAVRDRLRVVANAPGVIVTVGEYDKAMRLMKEGKDINYEGAAGSVEFDAAGDVITPIGVWKYAEGSPVDLFVVTQF